MAFPKNAVRYLTLALAICFLAPGCASFKKDRDVLYQVSTLNALLEGVYDGDVTFGDLKSRGDFGLGTFNALDGEMVQFDGKTYQVRSDGVAYPVADTKKTPFAVVTFFDPDKVINLKKPLSYKELKAYIDRILPSKNMIYAIKVAGDFSYVKTRSVPRQNRPYPRLIEVVKHQPTFEFKRVSGTLAGFRLPAYLKGVNVPGYHLHFLNQECTAGGHLLECTVESVKIEVDYTPRLYIVIPREGEFIHTDLTKGQEGEVDKIER